MTSQSSTTLRWPRAARSPLLGSLLSRKTKPHKSSAMTIFLHNVTNKTANTMNLRRSLLLVAALCVSPGLSATTYIYSGAPYTLVQNFTNPCGAGPCANYSLGEKISGQFTTAAPLAPNLVNQNVLPSVTSYVFSDGIDIYSSANLNSRVDNFVFSTDASGMITSWNVIIMSWQTGTSPHAAADRLARFDLISSTPDVTENNTPCAAVVTAPSGVTDACVVFMPDASTSFGDALTSGTWTVVQQQSIPTLSKWTMLLLLVLITGVGMRALRVVT